MKQTLLDLSLERISIAPLVQMKMILYSIFIVVLGGNLSFSCAQVIWSEPNRTVFEQMSLDIEFSKDISSILTEATLKSNCDGNVIITSEACRQYLDYTLYQMSEWAPPVLIVTFQDFKEIKHSSLWATFLAWKRRPCSLVFVCDIPQETETDGGEMPENGEEGENKADTLIQTASQDIGHLKLPKFIESSDQVLYLSDYIDGSDDVEMESRVANTKAIQSRILQLSGILLKITVENRTEAEPESLMRVYSVCEYCGESARWHQTELGFWQRNRTQFVQYLHIFADYHRLSFHNTNLDIGYFNHPPHFSCYSDGGQTNLNPFQRPPSIICEGVEWEMISQMGKSLDFTTTWINLSIDSGQDNNGGGGDANNISNAMIAAFADDKIDLAVGGISVTPKRIMHLDFSSVFANDPIVFVVRKKNDLFAFGIWLAFNPEIWPLILLLIGIISLLFHIIIYQYTLEPPKKSRWKWAMSTFLNEEPRKPIHVAMFEALEITLQPLLGQPLSTTQITHRPRRLLKLLLIIWWFSCLTITTLYNTSLITSLINPISPKEPEALQDLLDGGYGFKPAGKQGAFFELVKSVLDDLSGDGEEDDGYGEEGVVGDERRTVTLLKQISDRLVKDGARRTTVQIAYVIEESAVKRTEWSKKEIGFSKIRVIRERLFLTPYAWPTQRHAPFKKKIDSALGRLNSAGLVDYWYEEFGHRDEKDERRGEIRLREKLREITLNLQVLQGAFIFLLFGYGVGALGLGLEHLTKRYKFRFYTRQEIIAKFGKVMTGLKRIYGKHFASEHVELEARRRKNKMRFRGAVRTVTTFKPRNIPFLK